ncbi:MAG: class I SAM-dependent methyltransferase [Coriobacteriia bacterium]|nr:class I SAM-dependent methyltransferase [Coriobacteriia bacterium]
MLSRFAATCDIVGFGIDIAEEMLNVARDKCPQMVFHVARCDDMPFDDQSFDVITACMAYHHFDNKLGFASEAARVIKPGGMLYIADPRLPWLIRKTMNGALRLLRIAGEFVTPQEMAERFGAIGFTNAGVATDAYAQVVKLRRL